MMLSGLGGRFGGDEYVPRAVRVPGRPVRGSGHGADGGRPVHRRRGGGRTRSAHAFGARAVQVHELRRRPGYIRSFVGRLDALAAVVTMPPPGPGRPRRGAHRPPGGRPDLGRAPPRFAHPGRRGDRRGQGLGHLVADPRPRPAIRDGLVRLWVVDPKGGMELAAGAPLFDRFVYDDPAAMAAVLEDAVAVMQARAAPAPGPHPPARTHRRRAVDRRGGGRARLRSPPTQSARTAAASTLPCRSCCRRAGRSGSWWWRRCRTRARRRCRSGTCSPPASRSLRRGRTDRPRAGPGRPAARRGLLAYPAHHPGDRLGVVRRRTRTRPRPCRLGHRRRHRRPRRRLHPRHPAARRRECVVNARGLLHVLAGPSLGGFRGWVKGRRGPQVPPVGAGPSARLGLVRRALDADPDPATLPGRREGARPPQTDAA